ncbi:hypothetical protein LSTR_LSTR005625 [Laodelphax striatellus]|uniref:protein-tyrosine-phosphatase n=1 Tax=Laodelphax striatellus TaxID=195883 RepID=A0A482WUW7_LAOST|nr:hypothetical protein LSTR_LSTR005625 [Laodelphax striatellus]
MKNQDRTPLRLILLNFLNHIENLEADINEDSYETEFQELKLFSETLKSLKQYSCSEGEKEVNKKKNRYKDILPFDLSRVILNEYAGIPGSDYINANYIKGASGSPAYIASQGPLPHTVNDFWRMVVQCEVQVIVMACNEEEAGKHKCENYWVEAEGQEKQFGMVSIRLVKASTVCPDFSVRTMKLKYTNQQSNTEERTVCQFHYSAWPDHGVPPLVRPLLDMVRLVRDTQASETLPVLVHCSAGCGRTGTICAIDYVWGLLRAGKLTKDFSLLSLVREMRKQRIAMVQTKEQYVLVHQAVRELFKEQLRMIDSHPYENIDCNGMPIDSEPMYAAVENKQHFEVEKDNKEKEVAAPAPPLPVKKKFPVVSSKHEKEVENLSEKQRIAEQAGSGSSSTNAVDNRGHRPKITKLKSLFEKEIRQVSRSHSLGAPLKANFFSSNLKPVQIDKPTPSLSITVKRSKSLRVLGSSDRSKLSLHTEKSGDFDERNRRLSLESNLDVEHQIDPVLTSPTVDSIVAGLGTRERRNSFREAINRTRTQEVGTATASGPDVRRLVRSYTAIDIQFSSRERSENLQASTKPALRPKPPPQQPISARPITKSDVTWHAARSDTRPKSTSTQAQAINRVTAPKAALHSTTPIRDRSAIFSPASSNCQQVTYQQVASKVLANHRRPDTLQLSAVGPAWSSRSMAASGAAASATAYDHATKYNRTDPHPPRLKPNATSHSRFAVTDTQLRFPNSDVPRGYVAKAAEPGAMNSIDTPTRHAQIYHQQRQLFRDNDLKGDSQQSSRVDEIAHDLQNSRIAPHRNTNLQFRNEALPKPVSGKGETDYYYKYAAMNDRRQPTAAHGENMRNSSDPSSSAATAAPPPYGVIMRRGSRDDLALCSSAAMNRVKRHASVVVLRNSLIESTSNTPQLSLCDPSQANGDARPSMLKKESEDPWSGAVGVDLDEVAANMTYQKDGSSSKLMKAALQALHRRKGVPVPNSDPAAEPIYSGASSNMVAAAGLSMPIQQIPIQQQQIHQQQQMHQQQHMQQQQQKLQQQKQQMHQQLQHHQQHLHQQKHQLQINQKQTQHNIQQQQQQQQQRQTLQHPQTPFRKQQHYL